MISNALLRNGFNLLLFQALWFLCVLRADAVAAAIAFAGVGLHLVLVSQCRRMEARFLIMAAVLGIALDTLWQNLGVLRFPLHDGPYADGLIPNWLMALWFVFAMTINHALGWVRGHRYLPYILAPVAGPLAYVAAASLGPVEIGYGAWGYLALAVGWLAAFPLQLHILEWLEYREKSGHAA